MHYHELSPTICDYKQLIPIGYNYNQFEINDVSSFDWLGLHFTLRLHTLNQLDSQILIIQWVIYAIIFLTKVNLDQIKSEMWVIGAVRGRAPGPLGLGPWPCSTVYDPVPVGPMTLIWTHFEAQSEPKNHNESILSWTCQKQALADQL